MNEMLLLGAGASVEAGVPDAYDMTHELSDFFRRNPASDKHGHVISFVIGGLLFQQGVNGKDPLKEGVNVEDLFNAVQLLAERNTLEAAPFVGSWHSMVDQLDKSLRASPSQVLTAIQRNMREVMVQSLPQSPPSIHCRDIDTAIHDTVQKAVRGTPASGDMVGRNVGGYVLQIARNWLENMKAHLGYSSLGVSHALESMVGTPLLEANPVQRLSERLSRWCGLCRNLCGLPRLNVFPT